jgi:glucose/arabinose dehydrogenase
MRRAAKFILIIALLFLPASVNPVRAANTLPSPFNPALISFQEIASGLTNPVFITNAGDGSGRLFIVESGGRILIRKNGGILPAPFLDIHSIIKSSGGEQGLLALAFDPSYASNGNFYVVYTAPRSGDGGGSNLTLERFSVSAGDPDLADPDSGVVLLAISHPSNSNHNGGTLAFGHDGYLYWSTGDGGGGGDPGNNAQNLGSLLGKILRLDVHSGSPYSIPPGNPFYNNPSSSIRKEIWAYGLRNPWRFSFDRLTHDLYIGDVGQSNREEIDFQSGSSSGGQNYGWRVMEGSLCYNPSSGCNKAGKVLPIAEYSHFVGCAVTGGYVYRGSAYPALQGRYFYGDFCSGRIFSLYNDINTGWTTTPIAESPYNISTFGEDEQGELYLADYSNGIIYQFQYTSVEVLSITRNNPNPSNASSVDFAVNFSDSVTGVDVGDFALTTTGITGASISGISGADPGTNYIVTVSTGSGNGTIRLDVIDDDTIVNADSTPLGRTGPGNGNFTSGQIYTMTNAGISPANNSYAATATPTLTWRNASGVLEYHLQVDKTDLFTTIEVEHFQSGGTKYVSPALDYGTHYWRMRVRNINGWGAWSPPWKFTLTPPLPASPGLANPSNAALLADSTPTLTWNLVLEDDRYEVQIDNLKTFASPEQTHLGVTGGLSYTASPLPDGVYYWRVRTSNYLSIPGAWSKYRSFTVDTTPPATPASKTPPDGASVNGTPAFSWLMSATAIRYQFEYDNDSDFSSPVYTSPGLTKLTIKPPTMAPGAYFWHARARDAAGNWSDWSTTRAITILPLTPPAPVLTAPANAKVSNNQAPVFTWNPVAYGYTYQLEISGSKTFASILQTFNGAPGQLTYTATTLDAGAYFWRVRALNVDSTAGSWSAYRSFSIDTTPPAAPGLKMPADGASQVGTPAFGWLMSATAAWYQFEYDNDSGFSSPVYTSPGLTKLTIKPPTMAPGAYFWHARARDAAGNWSDWSTPRAITILPLTPPAPVLTAPANAKVSNNQAPVFTWNPVAYGYTYQLEISGSKTFASILQTFNGAPGQLTYTATTLDAGAYFWRVRALNVDSTAGSWSAYRSFSIDTTPPAAPASKTPPDGASVNGTPAFSWSMSSTAIRYQFEYDNDSDFSSPVYTSPELTKLTIKPPTMAPGAYFWHARARDAAGNWSNWSTTRAITILPLTPGMPTLTNPANGSITPNPAPTLTWGVTQNAASYRVQLDNNSTFSSPEIDTGALLTSLVLPRLADGVYYWRVLAVNNLAQTGPWSTVRRMTIRQLIPATPALLLPADGTTDATGLPSFSWESVENGTRYQVQVDDAADFSSPEFDDTDTSTTRTPGAALADGSYFWRVRAINTYDTPGEWSEPWNVIISVPPPAPVLTTPEADITDTTGMPAFSWEVVSNGVSYQIQVDSDADFSSPEFDDTDSTTTRTPGAPLADGTYFWRVRAINIYAVPGDWSETRTILIDVP